MQSSVGLCSLEKQESNTFNLRMKAFFPLFSIDQCNVINLTVILQKILLNYKIFISNMHIYTTTDYQSSMSSKNSRKITYSSHELGIIHTV